MRFHGRLRRNVGREQAAADTVAQDAMLAEAYAGACSPSRQAVAREQIERFETAFDALPQDHRQVVALARIAGLPHAVIAEQMGRSVGAVRQLLGRAMLRLAHELREREA